MRGRLVTTLVVGTGFVAALLSGCNLVSSLVPPIPIDLGADSSFPVTAGTPTSKTFVFEGGLDSPVAISGGSFDIDPAAITVNEAGGPGKRFVAAQDTPTCLTACNAAGVDAAICNQVCQEGDLVVTAWVGTPEAITADCQDGEEYVFTVTLNDDLVPTNVTVNPSTVSGTTRDLLVSEGGFGVCIQVISPVDGEVIIEGLQFRVQL